MKGRCIYCGGQALGVTCAGHSDLPALDRPEVHK